MSKQCSRCQATKPLTDFHRQPKGAMGRHSWCKGCFNAYARQHRNRRYTPEQRQRWNLSKRYGLTPKQVRAMLEEQGGVCAICQEPPKRRVVDHCHQTGRVRGVLCHGCNIKLAAVEDRTYLQAAKAYLSRSM